MVIFDRSMKLPLIMEERNDNNDLETFGSIDLVDQNGLFVGTITAEDEENRDEQNIIDTRKDAVFILNAVNSFDEMFEIIKDYQKLLLKINPKSKDLSKIDSLINSFKTIDYDNGIPYNWGDVDI
jgi:Mg/Co/Ni transporter MgtE